MAVRRLAPIAAVFLMASLAACNPSATKTDDSKPSAGASASSSAGADPSAAPGAPAGGSDLSLSEAIAKIPAGTEDRTGYERDSFHLWVDADKDGCDTRKEVLIAEAVKAPTQGARCALTGGEWLGEVNGSVQHPR
ncbi:hypothetical protein ACFU98_47320 [Streptomyces sp. NPDC057575]|uniref:hypothetical protein n=1 Tax=unclassified Streptomyces TaxID=2593676 RepID=UPI0036AEF444